MDNLIDYINTSLGKHYLLWRNKIHDIVIYECDEYRCGDKLTVDVVIIYGTCSCAKNITKSTYNISNNIYNHCNVCSCFNVYEMIWTADFEIFGAPSYLDVITGEQSSNTNLKFRDAKVNSELDIAVHGFFDSFDIEDNNKREYIWNKDIPFTIRDDLLSYLKMNTVMFKNNLPHAYIGDESAGTHCYEDGYTCSCDDTNMYTKHLLNNWSSIDYKSIMKVNRDNYTDVDLVTQL